MTRSFDVSRATTLHFLQAKHSTFIARSINSKRMSPCQTVRA